MRLPGKVLIYPNLEALSEAAAQIFATTAAQAVASRGRFSVALPGGGTPRLIYELLAKPPLRDRVTWPQVHLFWGDERSVPFGDPRSNYHLVRESLLQHAPLPPENVHPLAAYPAPEAGAWVYEDELRAFFGYGPPAFDLIFLGLGADGHTASLFPETAVLKEERRWVAPVVVPGQEEPRVTLTAWTINQAAMVVFLVSGKAKAGALKGVLEGPYKPRRLPAQLIRPVTGNLLWLADREAAAHLTLPS